MADLANINVGDALALYSLGWNTSLEKVVVTRTTKTRVEAGSRIFNRMGNPPGKGRWDRIRAEPWDEAKHPGEMANIRQERLLQRSRNRLRDFAWHEINAEQAAAAVALIDSWKVEK